MFLTNKQLALVGVAAIALALAVSLSLSVQVSFAQENEIVENFTDAIVPDNTEEQPSSAEPAAQPQPLLQEDATVVVTDTDTLLTGLNATFAAISTLVSTVIGIVVYIITAVRSKTGDKIISKDTEDKILDVFAQVRQKDNELRDVFRQVLEQKETLKVALDMVKSTNPEVARRVDETLPVVNKKIESEVLPQIAEWQKQADRFYETLQKKEPIGSRI